MSGRASVAGAPRRPGLGLILALAVGLLVLALPAIAQARSGLPHIRHVFIVVLENENADQTFGPQSPAPYLSKTLPSEGLFMPNYFATGHLSLDNYISLVSGQAPNPQTQADCQFFSDFQPGTPTADGQVIGSGCVYPSPEVQTIADQLDETGQSWKGYMEDMGTPCRHPALNSRDDTQSAEVGDQYATRHNPFVYFHSIIDSPTCAANDVDLSELGNDLKREGTTANYNFITPNLCNDGHDEPCVDGQPGGLVQADGWLKDNLAPIFHSPAYKRHGLVIVTFDEAEASGGEADASACCNEQPGPNTPNPGALTQGPGGGRIGAVMLSPCISPGSTTDDDYNHYSLLRSVEDNFGLPHLGYAGQEGLQPFDTKVLNRPDCQEKLRPKVEPKKLAAGERTTVKIKVRSRYARCYRNALVKLIDRSDPGRPQGARRRARTNDVGRAEIRTRVRAGTKLVARASKNGCVSGSVPVKVR